MNSKNCKGERTKEALLKITQNELNNFYYKKLILYLFDIHLCVCCEHLYSVYKHDMYIKIYKDIEKKEKNIMDNFYSRIRDTSYNFKRLIIEMNILKNCSVS